MQSTDRQPNVSYKMPSLPSCVSRLVQNSRICGRVLAVGPLAFLESRCRMGAPAIVVCAEQGLAYSRREAFVEILRNRDLLFARNA